ncbi:MAG: hypothetical protein LC746_13195 [Acidobacteria bacterium]|nr:hypothetical protein [Acidobacteriota bacterium]
MDERYKFGEEELDDEGFDGGAFGEDDFGEEPGDELLLDEEGAAEDEDELALDADDEEEDESAQVRTALLAKHEMLALLSLRTADDGGRIVRVDPRQPLPAAKSYDDAADALRWFRRSLATSRDNGWEVIYDGEPLYG